MEKEDHEEINLKKEKKKREAQDKRGKMTRKGRVKINRRRESELEGNQIRSLRRWCSTRRSGRTGSRMCIRSERKRRRVWRI